MRAQIQMHVYSGMTDGEENQINGIFIVILTTMFYSFISFFKYSAI